MWFVNWQLNGDMGIWQLPLDPVAFAPAGKAESVYPSRSAVPLDLRLSADGARLAFTAAFSQSAIMAQSIRHRASASVVDPRHELSLHGSAQRSGRQPPDLHLHTSKWLCSTVDRERRWDRACGAPSLGGADAFYGGLSADNRQAFFTEFRGNTPQLIAVNLVDGASKRLADLPDGAEQIACSRDCASALFHRVVDDRRQVYRLDTHAAASHVVVSRKDDVDFARFSRDDKWISVELTGPSAETTSPYAGGRRTPRRGPEVGSAFLRGGLASRRRSDSLCGIPRCRLEHLHRAERRTRSSS